MSAARIDAPLVSVVLSVHDGGPALLRAVRSLQWQTHGDWELILLDDGSTDGACGQVAALGDARIRILRDGRRRGLAARLNEGVAQARGVFLARMDADDVAFPERFARQVAFLQAHPEVDLLATSALLVDEADAVVGVLATQPTHDAICRRPWHGFPMPHPTWMGRTAWFQRHPYDEAARKGQDQALLVRTWRHSRFAGLPEVLLGYRYARLSLHKTLAGRRHFVRALWRHGRAGDALAGAALHGGMAVRDMLALATGTGTAIIQRRVQSVPPQALAGWRDCLSRLRATESIEGGQRPCAASPG
jgi:glycosyltransferase involved in cell wall biosynthesis